MNNREYDIAFVGLKPGKHEFNYVLTDKFFTDRGSDEITNVQANVKLTLEKNTGFMLLKFEVGGTADTVCDRCGNPLTLNLWDEFEVVVKMVDNADEMNEQEEDPDIYYISRTESHLHIADQLFEFVLLSMPTQRFCLPVEQGGKGCNKEVLDMLDKMKNEAEASTGNTIWKGLDKFKNN